MPNGLSGVPGALRPIERPLSPAAQRVLPFIQRGLREGASANAILRSLQEHGLGLRRTEFLAAVRVVQGRQLSVEKYLQGLGPNRRPDPSRAPRAIVGQARRWAWVVEVTGTFEATGEPITRYVTVSTSRTLTREDVAGEVGGLDLEDKYGIVNYDLSIVGVGFDPSAPVF